jgi:predicted component of type VI protein secretion system
MIVLTVLSYNGAPTDGQSGGFDEMGGTIGRAENNQLVLPDPERTISRVHARVVFRTTGYMIVDNGSNPISINGTPLGSGREHPLRPGDQVQIGGYLLAASEGKAGGAAADPFADLFGDAPVGLAVPAAAPKPTRSVTQTWTPAPTPMSAATPWPGSSGGASSPGQIPDDWDPFGMDPMPAPAPPSGQAGAGAAYAGNGNLLDLPASPVATDSLDDLFGLNAMSPSAQPLGASTAEVLQPNMARHADPLRSLAGPALVSFDTLGDLGSELNTPMPLPPPPLQAPPPPQPPVPMPSPVTPQPTGAIFSWDGPPRDGRVVTLPGVRRGEAEPAPTPPPPPPAPVRQAFAPAPAPTQGAGADGLLSALLGGLGVPGLRLDSLTPAMMELIGQLLRESTRGVVELLVARAALKREMRAEMTMIVARENNPLKFSPSVEVALQHLLGPPAPGFMAAAPAMRDAFDDLRAHQLGVMAGMKAASEGVLQRFDPTQLEAKLTKRSALSNLIPSSRKARLWELFQELFAQLSSEAQDDFDELFGKAFLKAYETQLDRLQNEPGPR